MKHFAQPQDAGRVGCRWQMPQQSLRLAVSWRPSKPHKRFDVERLWEQIEQMHFRDFITDAWPGNFFRFPERRGQYRQVACQCGWITGKIHNLSGSQLGELLSGLRAQSCSRRVLYTQNPRFVALL